MTNRTGVWVAAAAVAVLALSACDSGNADTASQQERAGIAQDVVDQISIEGVGFPCAWDDSRNSDDSLVYQLACEEHELIVGAADTGTGIDTWLDALAEDTPSATAVIGSHGDYAVVAFDQGHANRVWDLLGADGTVEKLRERQ